MTGRNADADRSVAAQCMAWTGQLPDQHERCVLNEGHDGDHYWESQAYTDSRNEAAATEMEEYHRAR